MQVNEKNNVFTMSSKGLVELVKDIIIGYTAGDRVDKHKGTCLVLKIKDGKDVLELPMRFTKYKEKKLINKQVEYRHTMEIQPCGKEYKVENEYGLLVYDINGKVESLQYSYVNYTTK